jgi:hypothetical protein
MGSVATGVGATDVGVTDDMTAGLRAKLSGDPVSRKIAMIL